VSKDEFDSSVRRVCHPELLIATRVDREQENPPRDDLVE
jgi:hypothetical protein